MRKFLVYVTVDKKTVILGLVESNQYPSTITNDHEYSKIVYGYDYVKVREISERCHVEI